MSAAAANDDDVYFISHRCLKSLLIGNEPTSNSVDIYNKQDIQCSISVWWPIKNNTLFGLHPTSAPTGCKPQPPTDVYNPRFTTILAQLQTPIKGYQKKKESMGLLKFTGDSFSCLSSRKQRPLYIQHTEALFLLTISHQRQSMVASNCQQHGDGTQYAIFYRYEKETLR